MEILEFMPFFDFETKVKITTIDKEEYIGIISGVNNDFDTYSGKDEIELYLGNKTDYMDIEIPDIVSIEKVYTAR